MPLPGATSILGDRWEFVGRLEAGRPVLGRDRVLDRAVRLVPLPSGGDPVRNRARQLVRLSHPHLVRIHSLQPHGSLDVLVVDAPSGRDLLELAADTTLRPQRVVELGVELLDALAWAHEHGVVHGDLQPESVLVDPEGGVIVDGFPMAVPTAAPVDDVRAAGELLAGLAHHRFPADWATPPVNLPPALTRALKAIAEGGVATAAEARETLARIRRIGDSTGGRPLRRPPWADSSDAPPRPPVALPLPPRAARPEEVMAVALVPDETEEPELTDPGTPIEVGEAPARLLRGLPSAEQPEPARAAAIVMPATPMPSTPMPATPKPAATVVVATPAASVVVAPTPAPEAAPTPKPVAVTAGKAHKPVKDAPAPTKARERYEPAPPGAVKVDPPAPAADSPARPQLRRAPEGMVLVRPGEGPAFFLDRTPVTHTMWLAYLEANDMSPPAHWVGRKVPAGKDNHPVVGITYREAEAYAAWRKVRLPREPEWMYAAKGEGRRFPWGEANCTGAACSCGKFGAAGTEPVEAHPTSATPEGVLDLIGNVWEYVEGRAAEAGRIVAVGGSFRHPCKEPGQVPRTELGEASAYLYVGFRCAADAEEPV